MRKNVINFYRLPFSGSKFSKSINLNFLHQWLNQPLSTWGLFNRKIMDLDPRVESDTPRRPEVDNYFDTESEIPLHNSIGLTFSFKFSIDDFLIIDGSSNFNYIFSMTRWKSRERQMFIIFCWFSISDLSKALALNSSNKISIDNFWISR